MRQIRSALDIKSLGTIMGIWAHPDDETFTSAGIMATAVANGQKVICLTATKGEAGVQDEKRWPKDKLGNIREKELETALKIIGVKEHRWLSYKDGCCFEVDTDEAVGCICDYIEEFKPDTILTFGPEGMTGHPDHQTMCTWASLACKRLEKAPAIFYAVPTHHQYKQALKRIDDKLNIFFNVRKPHLVVDKDCDILFELDDQRRDIKFRALEAMPSQYQTFVENFSRDEICQALSPEAFVIAKK